MAILLSSTTQHRLDTLSITHLIPGQASKGIQLHQQEGWTGQSSGPGARQALCFCSIPGHTPPWPVLTPGSYFLYKTCKSAFVFIRPALGITRRGTHCDSQSTETLSVVSLLLSIPCRCIWRMCTALNQAPSHCQLPRAFPREDPNWSLTGFLEFSRAL